MGSVDQDFARLVGRVDYSLFIVTAAHGNERDELTDLVAKMEPRLLAGHAVDKLSPVPIPRRLVYGPRKR